MRRTRMFSDKFVVGDTLDWRRISKVTNGADATSCKSNTIIHVGLNFKSNHPYTNSFLTY